MPRLLVAAALGAGVLIGSTARAQTPSETDPPSCLDESIKGELGEALRPRGVQRRHFLKGHRFELVARGGLFASDLFSSSYIVGGAAAYWFTEDLALEVSFDLTPVALDLDEPIADFFQDDRFETPGMAYLALANLLWSPVHAKMKIGGGIVHSDFLFALGAGRLFHDTAQGVSFDAGFIMELYTTGWLTLRLDFRDVIAIQEAVGETRLTNNLTATFGLGFWVPFW